MTRSTMRAFLLGTFLLFGAVLPVHASTLTPAQVSAIISLLQAFNADPVVIAQVSAQLGGAPAVQTQPQTQTQFSCTAFPRDLGLGSTGADVINLQNRLIAQGYLGSSNNTGYYGPLTASAVGKLQVMLGLMSSQSDVSYGIFGPKTRAAVGCASTTTTNTTTTTASPTTPGSLSGWLLGAPSGIGGSDTQIYKIHPDGTGKTFLTFGGTALAPAWSWDGARIVYAAAGANGVTIWTMNADGTNQRNLGPNGVSPAFSPDGKRIVYQALSAPSEVWVMDADGTNRKQLTHTTAGGTMRGGNYNIGAGSPTFSPDGSKISYTSSQSGRNQIWTMSPDGTNQVQLTNPSDPAAPDANAARWSPDGKRIVFFAGFETEYGNVWIMNADGTGRAKLSTCVDVGTAGRSANCDGPSFSADGNSIIFQSNKTLTSGFIESDPMKIRTWIMNLDGTNLRVLVDPALNYGTRPWTAQ